MTQMLKAGEGPGNYKAIMKISAHHDGVREVYLAEDSAGRKVALTVFNTDSKRYAPSDPSELEGEYPDFIDEIRFMMKNSGMDNLPELIDRGYYATEGHRYAWMVQNYVDGERLDSLIRNLGYLDLTDAVEITLRIGKIVEKVTDFTNGGGHYNISPDNVLVSLRNNEIDSKGVHLVGFSNIGPLCQGAHHIDLATFDKRMRTPEADLGIFTSRTDVYALGMLLMSMISGYPSKIETADGIFNLSETDFDDITALDYYRSLWRQADKTLSQSFRLILHKATALPAANRFANVRKFCEYIAKISGSYRNPKLEQEDDAKHEENVDKQPVPTEEGNLTVNEGMENLRRETCKAKELKGSGCRALDDVAGMAELKEIFRRDFIRILRNPKVAEAYGIKPSNCTLLYGPQGCGKTFIAEKAAQESGLKYKTVSPSDLGSIYVHGSQQKISDLFDEAEKKAPMILIFDEFDAIVPNRESDNSGSQANEVNEMLTQLNNCAARGIYVLATTNRPTLLDPAILRKGRIDHTFYVPLPDKEARSALFRMETEKRPHEGMDYEALAESTENHTCSDISFIVEETARLCFEETIERGLKDPLPLSMERMMRVIRQTPSSVSDAQRMQYLDIKARMESGTKESVRKKVGFTLCLK